MDCQSTNLFEITKEFGILTENGIKEIDKSLEDQLFKLDVLYNNLLKSAKNDLTSDYEPEKKTSKRQSKAKNGQVGDLFASDPNFQQPAIPPIRRTKRQASIMAVDKMKSIRESATISSGSSTRASRARALSTFMDIAPIDFPKANSTFVVDKKCMELIDECISPQMFSVENEPNLKPVNPNETYNKPTSSTTMNIAKKFDKIVDIIPEKSPVHGKNNVSIKQISSKKKSSEEHQIKNKQREKLEDIDVNIEDHSLQHMTRTMKRKLQEENQIAAKKTNVVHVPLEKILTPFKPIEDVLQTPHQIRENEAEKRKELYLKSKADQKKFDNQHIKVAKQREEQLKRVEEKIKKAAEEKKKKEEKQKEETLKKQKQTELKLAEINAKRKQVEEAKMLKMQKAEAERKLKEAEKERKLKEAEMERKLKEAEIKKKVESKLEKNKSVRPKVVNSNLPFSVSKAATLRKSKVVETESNANDYGLHDVSARDSSDDESGPKKPVPSWAKRENRKAVLEIQSHVDSAERDLFFNCPTNISLKEMFKGWNIRNRQRTSSAIWNTPPRYSEYIRKH